MDDSLQPHLPVLAAGGVVYTHSPTGQLLILLIQDKHGVWTLPKGHVEAGESLEQTAVREVAEETGLDCVIERLVHCVQYPVYKKGAWRDKEVTYFLASADHLPPAPRCDEGIRCAAWIPLSEALALIGYAQVREIVRRATCRFAR
ncbi:NUDIX domain-containing protein [Candidatus Gracilibacteria bacterium]|nr:NUDIX domain-containing protein [Candidatus Gracilibacteria bacterium]